jgi:hypothetical protein
MATVQHRVVCSGDCQPWRCCRGRPAARGPRSPRSVDTTRSRLSGPCNPRPLRRRSCSANCPTTPRIWLSLSSRRGCRSDPSINSMTTYTELHHVLQVVLLAWTTAHRGLPLTTLAWTVSTSLSPKGKCLTAIRCPVDTPLYTYTLPRAHLCQGATPVQPNTRLSRDRLPRGLSR